MQVEYIVRPAAETDLDGMKAALARNGQKSTILLDDRSLYWLAETPASGIIGLSGAEICRDSALIRSTAVLAPYRGNGVAKKLVEGLFNSLKGWGIQKLYLFSRDTGSFWEAFGFVRCPVEEVIAQLPDAHQVIYYLKDNSIWTDVAWKKWI